MNQEDRRTAAELKLLIKEVEAGAPERAAWIAIQDRAQALYLDEEGRPRRTQAEVSEIISKGRRWVQEVLAWNAAHAASPFSRDGRPETRNPDPSAFKRVARNPEQRRTALAGMEPAELARLAQAAESEAARKMEHEHVETKRNAKAIRQEHPRSTSKIQEMLIATILDSARSRVVEAVRKLVDAEGELTEKALERLRDKNEELATAVEAVDELLTGRTDWDAALAELTEG